MQYSTYIDTGIKIIVWHEIRTNKPSGIVFQSFDIKPPVSVRPLRSKDSLSLVATTVGSRGCRGRQGKPQHRVGGHPECVRPEELHSNCKTTKLTLLGLAKLSFSGGGCNLMAAQTSQLRGCGF